MKRIIKPGVLLFIIGLLSFWVHGQDATSLLEKIDQNLSSKNRIMESTMTIRGKRSTRSVTSKSYAEGDKKSFSEYLSPASEKGTKMLKLEGQLWIYSPATDRIIQISGHLLRQSVLGSDLSYEDMMDDRKLTAVYTSRIVGQEQVDSVNAKVLELTAKVEDVAYYSRKLWVDVDRFVPLKQELYAKSGQLLKRMEISDIQKIEGRWYPTLVIFKDMLKDGNGTEFKINSIRFNQEIPKHIFSKAALKQ